MPVNTEAVTRTARLVVGSRARGRLRLSLGRILASLTREFGARPSFIRIAGQNVRPTPDGRIFLNPSQVRRLGGMRRAGSNARIQFGYPLRRRIVDFFFKGDNSAQVAEHGGAGAEIELSNSGIGILLRAEQCSRKNIESELRRVVTRLQNKLGGWLTDFELEGPFEGISNNSMCGPGGQKRKWLVQLFTRRGGTDTFREAAGAVPFHTSAFTTFNVQSNEGITPLPAAGSFTVR